MQVVRQRLFVKPISHSIEKPHEARLLEDALRRKDVHAWHVGAGLRVRSQSGLQSRDVLVHQHARSGPPLILAEAFLARANERLVGHGKSGQVRGDHVLREVARLHATNLVLFVVVEDRCEGGEHAVAVAILGHVVNRTIVAFVCGALVEDVEAMERNACGSIGRSASVVARLAVIDLVQQPLHAPKPYRRHGRDLVVSVAQQHDHLAVLIGHERFANPVLRVRTDLPDFLMRLEAHICLSPRGLGFEALDFNLPARHDSHEVGVLHRLSNHRLVHVEQRRRIGEVHLVRRVPRALELPALLFLKPRRLPHSHGLRHRSLLHPHLRTITKFWRFAKPVRSRPLPLGYSRPAMAAEAFCNRVLERARASDSSARISSVSRRDLDDATLVRVHTSSSSAMQVLETLRAAWPLATVTLVENLLTGRKETQVLLPNERDQMEIAKRMAHDNRGQLLLRGILRLLLVMLLGSCVACIVR